MISILALLIAALPLRADPTSQEKDWLEHVLLGTNPASPGVACSRWNKAVALVPAAAKGDELTRLALRELARALGLIGESPEFADSVFFRKDQLATVSTSLSRRDKKLIVFLYNKIAPGDKLPQVQAQYKSW